MADTVDKTKRRRVGTGRNSIVLPADEVRGHCVSVRLNADELAQLDTLCSSMNMQRGEYLRAASLHIMPPPPVIIPALNKTAWTELAAAASNLNQLMRAVYFAAPEKKSFILNSRRAAAELFDFRVALLSAGQTLGDELNVEVDYEGDE